MYVLFKGMAIRETQTKIATIVVMGFPHMCTYHILVFKITHTNAFKLMIITIKAKHWQVGLDHSQ